MYIVIGLGIFASSALLAVIVGPCIAFGELEDELEDASVDMRASNSHKIAINQSGPLDVSCFDYANNPVYASRNTLSHRKVGNEGSGGMASLVRTERKTC